MTTLKYRHSNTYAIKFSKLYVAIVAIDRNNGSYTVIDAASDTEEVQIKMAAIDPEDLAKYAREAFKYKGGIRF